MNDQEMSDGTVWRVGKKQDNKLSIKMDNGLFMNRVNVTFYEAINAYDANQERVAELEKTVNRQQAMIAFQVEQVNWMTDLAKKREETIIYLKSDNKGLEKCLIAEQDLHASLIKASEIKTRLKMKILVACEESQTVTMELRKLGHEAYSNDIIECSGGHPEWHMKMDCFDAIRHGVWDMIIMHPPCTAMAVSGNSTYGLNKNGSPKPKHHERIKAVKWTQELWDEAVRVCGKVAMENPVGVLNTMGDFPKAKYVQPYQFGHMEQKKTGLWLHGLEPLKETNNVYHKMMKLPKNERERLHYLPPSPDRAKIRSKTYLGIAEAIADQWAGHNG